MVSEERKRLIMGVTLVFFMVSSVFGVLFFGFNTGGAEPQAYGDYLFKPNQNQWQVKIDGKRLLFNYHPLDVDYINVSQDLKDSLLNAKMIYFTSDPQSIIKESAAQTAFVLSRYLNDINIYPVNGFTNKTSFNLPVITCDNSTPAVPVVLMQYGNSTSISNDKGCIILEGDSSISFEKITERLLYMFYGVIA